MGYTIRDLKSYQEMLDLRHLQYEIWRFDEPGTGLYPPLLVNVAKKSCRNLLLGSLFILVFAACQAMPVVEWHWERAETGLPRQAIVTAVAANPANSDQLWIGTYAQGGLALTVDGGHTWQVGGDGLADNPVFDLLVIPTGEKVEVWAATRDGLFSSLDQGANWRQVKQLPPVTVFALAADAQGRLYVGLDNEGIYAQTPDRQGWLALGHEKALSSAAILSLVVSSDGQQIYAGTAARGIFASRDGGQTWTAEFSDYYAPNVALNPANPAQAVASLRDQLIRTADGGRSWEVTPVPWAQEEVVSLLWLIDGTLGAGTGKGGLYRSLDGGQTWLEGDAGLRGRGGVLDLEITGARQVLAGTWGNVYSSRDEGQTWQMLAPDLGVPTAQVLLTTETDLLLGARTGLFRWQPGSQRWQATLAEFPPGGLQSLAGDPENSHILYAGTSGDGLYRSDNNGQTWQRLPSLGVGIPAIAVDPADGDRLYILAAWERVYESKDGGQTWLANWNGLGESLETVSIAVDARAVGGPIIYVGAEAGLYRRQGNENWQLTAPELADQSVLALLVQPVSPSLGGESILYLGATRGLYRSIDGGVTVQSCSEGRRGWGCGLENISVTALLVDPAQPQQLYAGTAYQGVFQSPDWGHTWQPIGPAGLAQNVVESMAWGPAGELFVAAEEGVWRGVRR